jgi:hypothetical protein
MAEITERAEPRPSLLWAVYFTGVALVLAAGKSHVGEWAGHLGQWLMIGSVAVFCVRAWYLCRT